MDKALPTMFAPSRIGSLALRS